ncbi:MAG: hypothetical protein JNK76_09750 [Planctomycetales bacterium]|nr:hypothetical protein [Planctomycetales bacterium]MBN8625149.1 hypothetical protein [Planctomycetota bacterium]
MSLFRHWKTILLVLVVFAAGMFCGAVGTIRAVQRDIRNKLDETTWMPRTLDWLRGAANLTPAQEDKAKPIVESAVARLKELRRESEAERKSVVKDLLISVALQLPEDQQHQLKQAAEAAAAKQASGGLQR